jgi:hypothetical protein
VRPGIVSFLVLVAAGALAAEDARVTFLSKQLATAKDPRVRAQTALLLGQTGSESAVQPLCAVLKDPEAIVRTAAASGLGEIGTDGAVSCLKAALGESDPAVRTAMEKALKAKAGPGTPVEPSGSGRLYVHLEPVQDKVGGLSDEAIALAERLVREKLVSLGASFAPPNEDKKAAANLIRAKKLQGYQLRLQLLPGANEKALKVEMLIMSYPEQALKGTWNVKAGGAKPESLIKAMVPRVVDDAANDLDWKN